MIFLFRIYFLALGIIKLIPCQFEYSILLRPVLGTLEAWAMLPYCITVHSDRLPASFNFLMCYLLS